MYVKDRDETEPSSGHGQDLLVPTTAAIAARARARGLVERDDAIAVLGALFREAVQGKGRLALLDGPMGSGKSALAGIFLEAVRDAGAVTLSATARRRESSLPFGVMAQLLCAADLPREFRELAGDLLASMTDRDSTSHPAAETVPVETIRDFHRLSQLLARTAETVPLVLEVDNLQHVDMPSLRCLTFLVPRFTSARILVLLTDDASSSPCGTALWPVLSAQPKLSCISLKLLSEEGTARLLARQLGDEAGRRLTLDLFNVSAGNPLVLKSLVFDHQSGTACSPQGYALSLLRCLRQRSSLALDVVRVLAVLEDSASHARARRLADAHDADVARILDSLEAAGLVENCQFRHPAARGVVLNDMSAPARSGLHRRAAELLHDEGAPVIKVADQLVHAGEARVAWAADVLLAAAAEALAANRVQAAAGYLRLAEQAGSEAALGAAVRSRLSRVEWQLNPVAAARRLSPLVADASSGYLKPDEVVDLAWRLAWYGHLDEVADVLGALRSHGQGKAEVAEHVGQVATWLTCLYPLAARSRWPARPGVAASTAAAARSDPWVRTAAALAGGLMHGEPHGLPPGPDRLLQHLRLDHDSLWSGESGLLALLLLLYADQLETVTSRCDRLLADARACDVPVWEAVFTAIRAEAALRRGDLRGARSQAMEAFSLLPPAGWGVMVGLPRGCVILAAVRMGCLGLAEKHVAQVFPEAMLQSRYAAHYLYARGHYRLATGQPQAALADFLACGEFTAGWGIAGTGLVQWRTGAAEAWLELRNRDRARRLVRDQLVRLPPGNSRARGLSLRVLAAVSGVSQRPRLLTDAVDILRHCGDTFELARALNDLSHAYRQVGDRKNAQRRARQAWHAAMGSGAAPLCREAAVPGGDSALRPGHDARGEDSLTDQQRCVASLAAVGYTNEEIAAKLFITASTVEQHLTKVFRKLSVKRRHELPRYLHPDPGALPPGPLLRRRTVASE